MVIPSASVTRTPVAVSSMVAMPAPQRMSTPFASCAAWMTAAISAGTARGEETRQRFDHGDSRAAQARRRGDLEPDEASADDDDARLPGPRRAAIEAPSSCVRR